MPDERNPDQSITLRGEGATPADAARSLLSEVLAVVLGQPPRPGDQATVIRAAAPTLGQLVSDLTNAVLTAAADLDLGLTDATLDGLIATDDGWRAWGTVSGEPMTRPAPLAWRAARPATVATSPGAVVMNLSLLREPADG